jgi:hypothetical protein
MRNLIRGDPVTFCEGHAAQALLTMHRRNLLDKAAKKGPEINLD